MLGVDFGLRTGDEPYPHVILMPLNDFLWNDATLQIQSQKFKWVTVKNNLEMHCNSFKKILKIHRIFLTDR